MLSPNLVGLEFSYKEIRTKKFIPKGTGRDGYLQAKVRGVVGEGQLALTLGSQLQEHLKLQMAAELMAAFPLRLPTLGVQALFTSLLASRFSLMKHRQGLRSSRSLMTGRAK